jgi:PTS system fructose-specific IIA component/PTS system nitrogen regulatory IIA component
VLKLSDIMVPGAVKPQLAGKDAPAVVGELVRALTDSGAIPQELSDDIAERVLQREKVRSTGFGRGVAVPHAKHPGVPRIACALGIAPRGIDFDALDRQPVFTVFLLVSPEANHDDHLRAMEVIFRHLSKDTFRRQLRQAQVAEEIAKLLQEADSHRLGV